jgi:hypothetical protein
VDMPGASDSSGGPDEPWHRCEFIRWGTAEDVIRGLLRLKHHEPLVTAPRPNLECGRYVGEPNGDRFAVKSFAASTA